VQRVRTIFARPSSAAAAAAAGIALASLAGCASMAPPAAHVAPAPADAPSREMPPLRLAPALLGHALNLQQHITVLAPGHEQQLDVLLEADAAHVQLGVVAMGQVAARLDWDGVTLTESRAPWWPQAVSGARILGDLQLTLWPVAAIQAALPAGWQLVENGGARALSQGGELVTLVTHPAPRVVEIEQRREHFRLRIESEDLGAGNAATAPDMGPASAAASSRVPTSP